MALKTIGPDGILRDMTPEEEAAHLAEQQASQAAALEPANFPLTRFRWLALLIELNLTIAQIETAIDAGAGSAKVKAQRKAWINAADPIVFTHSRVDQFRALMGLTTQQLRDAWNAVKNLE